MNCARCGKPFKDGDIAYVQMDQVIKVRGTKVETIYREVLVCEEHK